VPPVEIDTEAEWYPILEMEMLRFPKSTYKDQVDMLAMFASNIHRAIEALTPEEEEEEDYQNEWADEVIGLSPITGY